MEREPDKQGVQPEGAEPEHDLQEPEIEQEVADSNDYMQKGLRGDDE